MPKFSVCRGDARRTYYIHNSFLVSYTGGRVKKFSVRRYVLPIILF